MTETTTKLEEKTIILDGQKVTKEVIQEKKGDLNIRLHQEDETTFRTLQKLQD